MLDLRWGSRSQHAACVDRIEGCSIIPHLFDNSSCLWPAAELCLKTCGECRRVAAARDCMCLPDDCSGDFCGDRVDWSSFFARVVAAQKRGARIVSTERPWVAELPNFLTSTEADLVQRVGMDEGLADEHYLPNAMRNVSVAHCDSARCRREPFIGELYRRVSNLMKLPPNNFETFEFLRYEPGQHYTWHRDSVGWRSSRPKAEDVLAGPRVLTVMFYLTDYEEGGETAFAGGPSDSKVDDPRFAGEKMRPHLLIKPEKGKALVWANMKDNWFDSEPGALHTGLPVIRGVKWAATLWVHPSGYRIPELHAGRQCHVYRDPAVTADWGRLTLTLTREVAEPLGLTLAKHERGLLIGMVKEGTLAERAGFQAYDLIEEISGVKPGASPDEMLAYLDWTRDNGGQFRFVVSRKPLA